MLALKKFAGGCWVFAFMLTACQQPSSSVSEDASITTKESETEADDPADAAAFEYHMLRDPRTGKIPAGIRAAELQQAKEILLRQQRGATTSSLAFTNQGPANIGGRTRAVVYDVRYNGTTNRTMMAGGVSGGIFKSIDEGAGWVRKTSTGNIHSVTTIAQDPRPGHQDTWYYGTGEFFGGNEHVAAPPDGDGVFRSLNNGETWTKLPQSNTGIYEEQDRREDHVERIVVHPLNGQVYMAVSAGIYRSSDGGDHWSPVLIGASANYNGFYSTDITVTSTGRLYAAFSGYNQPDVDGVWTSATGDPGSWTRIAGDGNGNLPAGWDADQNYGRIVLALAPSQQNILYAFVQSFTDICPSMRCKLFRYDALSSTWVNLSNNLPGCASNMDALYVQGGYDMTIAVKPDDPQVVFIGGTNLYRSTNAFNTSDQVKQIGGYNNWDLHPDMHWITFRPGDANTLVCGNDGGIQYTSDDLAPAVQWTTLNHNYSTVQYYYVTLDPRPGNDKIMGGSQDNGTLRNVGSTGSAFEMVGGGDGCAVGLSNEINGNTFEYTSYQVGGMVRRNASWVFGQESNIIPWDISYPVPFVTLFHLDPDNTEYLYYVNRNRLYRTTSASTVNAFNWTQMTGVGTVTDVANFNYLTALATTRGAYHATESVLYLGNDHGSVFRLDDPANAPVSTVPYNITGPQFNEWAYISSIAVNPRNDDTILVTCSNYNVLSIWWTGNAKSPEPEWINVERNLTRPSVRSSAIAVTANGVEYFVGTSVGLYRTSDPLNLDWQQEGVDEIGNAVVRSLAIRPADNKLLVGTYGNGLWTTMLSSPVLPVVLTHFSGKTDNTVVSLQWNTSSEFNTDGFAVQRSYDASHFVDIGYERAKGAGAYTFIDRQKPAPKNYYRLGIRDRDGTIQFSQVILVRADNKGNGLYVTSPFSNRLDVHVNGLSPGTTILTLFDLSGRQLATKSFNYSSQELLTLDTPPGLPAGIYLLKMTPYNGEAKAFRVKKQ